MFRAAGIVAAGLAVVATLALAQGASTATDAAPASRASTPAVAPASAFTNDQKGVKRTGNPSAGQVGTVTPGGGAMAQSGQLSAQESMQRGSGVNSKPHSNSGADQTDADAATGSTSNRGKPSKEQKTQNELRSNNARTTSPIVSNGSGRAPGAAATPGTSTGDSSGNKSFFESRSNTARKPDSAGLADDAAAQRASKINTSKSNLRTGNGPAEAAGKPAPAEAAPGSTSSILK